LNNWGRTLSEPLRAKRFALIGAARQCLLVLLLHEFLQTRRIGHIATRIATSIATEIATGIARSLTYRWPAAAWNMTT
jgi:hypothetical protein